MSEQPTEGFDMSTSLESVGAISLFVEDPRRAQTFYERVFDAPLVYEDDASAVFKFGGTVINLLSAAEAPGLIAPAFVAAQESGARLQLTIWVDDTDAVCARLAERGVDLINGPMDRAWGVRTACFADPDGHIWEVAQQLGAE
jgi:catechol 2,3-dioxygenase-like lactoylglutathione lyase family enzyme